MIYTYDVETFAHDWLIVFKSIRTGEYTVIHNDNYAVKEFMTADKLLVCAALGEECSDEGRRSDCPLKAGGK